MKKIKRSYDGVIKVGDVVAMMEGVVAAVNAVPGAISMGELQDLVEKLVTS